MIFIVLTVIIYLIRISMWRLCLCAIFMLLMILGGAADVAIFVYARRWISINLICMQNTCCIMILFYVHDIKLAVLVVVFLFILVSIREAINSIGFCFILRRLMVSRSLYFLCVRFVFWFALPSTSTIICNRKMYQWAFGNGECVCVCVCHVPLVEMIEMNAKI